MKNGKTEHFWRIHARVTKRLLSDLPLKIQDVIASDSLADESKWFEAKVLTDATRLYEDESYYDNAPETFRIPRTQSFKIQPHWARA